MVLLNINNFKTDLFNSDTTILGQKVIAMKGYYILLRSPELEPDHLMQFGIMSRIPLLGVLTPLQRDTVSIF